MTGEYTTQLAELFKNVTVGCLFMAIIGQILHVFARLLKLFRSKKQFVWKQWVIENTLETGIAFFSMIALLVIISKAGQMNEITAFFIGYTTDSLLKQITATKGKISAI